MKKERLQELAGVQLNEGKRVSFKVEIDGNVIFAGRGEIKKESEDETEFVVLSNGRTYTLQLPSLKEEQ